MPRKTLDTAVIDLMQSIGVLLRRVRAASGDASMDTCISEIRFEVEDPS